MIKKVILLQIYIFALMLPSFGQKTYMQGLQDGNKNGQKVGFLKGFQFLIDDIILAKQNKITVEQNELKRLVAQIMYYRSKDEQYSIPIINTFTRYEIYDKYGNPDDYIFKWKDSTSAKTHLGQYYNIVEYQNKFMLPDSNEFLVEMHGVVDGGENFPYVLGLFRKDNSRLHFIGLLDQIYNGSMGNVKINELIQISDKSYLLIGTYYSGDMHYRWGYLWISYWGYPFDLEILYKKEYDYNLKESKKELSHNFLREDLQVEIKTKEQKVLQNNSFNYGELKTVEIDTISIAQLLLNLRKIRIKNDVY